MRVLHCLLFGASLIGLTVGSPFRLYECENVQDKLVTFNNLFLSQHPVTIPGHVRASGDVTLSRDVDGHLQLDVWVQKYFYFVGYVTIPCISNVGSCTYDVCHLLTWFLGRGGCPWQLVASNFPCMCPFTHGTYTLTPQPFYIPGVQGPWTWIAFGDFRVSGRLTDTRTNTVVGCYTVEFTVQEDQPISFWDMWK